MEEHRKWGIGVKELALLAVSDQVGGAAGMAPHGEVVGNGTTLRVQVVFITVMAEGDRLPV
jgi:hypothetical protein